MSPLFIHRSRMNRGASYKQYCFLLVCFIIKILWVMKNIILLLMFCTLLGASCTSVDIERLGTNDIAPRFTLPVITGESSFDVNSQKTYTIQNTPLLYTIDWIVLNATIISKSSTKPGRYVIMGQGSPTENLQYSFEIKQGDVSNANRVMQMSLEIDERMWHPLLTTKSIY